MDQKTVSEIIAMLAPIATSKEDDATHLAKSDIFAAAREHAEAVGIRQAIKAIYELVQAMEQ